MEEVYVVSAFDEYDNLIDFCVFKTLAAARRFAKKYNSGNESNYATIATRDDIDTRGYLN